MTSDALVDKCKTTSDAASAALKWFADAENSDLVGPAGHGLEREFRRFSNHSRILANAVTRPMCVGLFGPSQAGKSYLAAGLSRKGAKPLMIRFQGEGDKHFLSQINPEGDRESTGVVTRFSLRTHPHPDGFPVALRLLTESDVIKIFGNSYFFDSDPKLLQPMAGDAIKATLEQARSMASPGAAGMAREEVWDIQEYFVKQFSHLSPMTALGDYWDEAEKLAPQLDVEGRAVLFAPLWGAHEKLSQAYLAMAGALRQLGFPKDAYAGIDALIPRAKSIIDVETLKGLNDPAADTLAVRTMNGAPVVLPRPVITALIAELQLTIAEKPWDFFEHTDLLDFPGARNRDPVDLSSFFDTQEDALKQLLVRGKVAYLFDRYVAEQELTSMLLVVKPSNQDIVGLPGLVGEWIERTHGATPKDRAGRPTLLFFVLGWFNEHLKRLPGEDPDDLGGRYRSRMKTAITDFFGKSHEWPHNWADGKPFSNSYWLRDPGFSTSTFEWGKPEDPADLPEGQDTLELCVKPEEAERIETMRQAYLEVDEIQRFFGNPAEAWDRAMEPADGGVSHLAKSLAPVCEPDMKRRQVEARINDLRTQMAARLAPYFVSDDVDKRIAERKAVAYDVLESIETVASRQRLATLLKYLQIDEGALVDHLQSVALRPTGLQEDTPPPAEDAPAKRRGGRFGPKPTEAQAAAAPAPARRQRDKFDETCDEIVSAWLAILGDRADNARILRHIGMPSEHMKEMVAELAGGARRSKLSARIAEQLRRFNFPDSHDRALARNAVIGAQQINSFVSTLGYDVRPAAQRPTYEDSAGDQVPVFQVKPLISAHVTLPEEPEPTEDRFLDQWGWAYLGFIEENASSSEGQSVNRKQNNALGRILHDLGGEGIEGQ